MHVSALMPAAPMLTAATVQDTAGKVAYVPKAGAAPILFRISSAGLAKLQDQVFPRQAAAGGSAATAALIGGLLGVLPGVIGGGDGDNPRRQPTQPQSPNNQTSDYPGKP